MEDKYILIYQVSEVFFLTFCQQVFKKMLMKRIDIYPQDIYVGLSILMKNFSDQKIDLITYHPKLLRNDPGYLILSKNVKKNARMIVIFNKGLSRLKANGKLDEYLNKWDGSWDCDKFNR